MGGWIKKLNGCIHENYWEVSKLVGRTPISVADFKRKLLATTDTELKTIASLAIIGSSRKPLTTTTASPILHRRANLRPVRTVNTTIPFFGAQHFSTTFAIIKILASVGRHRFFFLVIAPGASDRRL
jgi:hypothetical protein